MWRSFGDIRSSIEEICGAEVVAKVGKVWGLDTEGELQGVWRRTGHPRLWIAMGKFSLSKRIMNLAKYWVRA